VRVFRHLLWQRLSIAALFWLLVATTTSFSGNTIVAGLSVLGACGLCAGVLEWRAGKKLNDLTQERRAS